MKNGTIDLYDIHKENGDWISLSAEIKGDSLTILRDDFFDSGVGSFGSDEIETYYYFDVPNTAKLAALMEKLMKTKNLLKALDKFFNHEPKDKDFFRLCIENGIEYSSSRY